MNINWKPLAHAIATFSLTVGSCTGVLADDTEIFFNIPSGSIKPNVLFLLDNSGSMRTEVTTSSEYDPGVTYTCPTSAPCVDPKQIFLKHNSSYYLLSNNACNSIWTQLNSVGVATNYTMARWRESYTYKNNKGKWVTAKGKWIKPDNSIGTSMTECLPDSGIHGETATSSAKYAMNSDTSQWSTNSAQEIDWSRIGVTDYYVGNYVNWENHHKTTTTRTRLEIVQDVARNLARSTTGINIGLMTFRPDATEEGGHVVVKIGDIDTTKSDFIDGINSLGPDTWTPLSEALFEAMHYLGGKAPFLDTSPYAKGVVTSGKYNSPITHDCQANHVVIMTDGQPTRDDNHQSTIESVVGHCTDNCLDEIAGYMHTKDIHKGMKGVQTATIHTVGFDNPAVNKLMIPTAKAGGGKFYEANDGDSLAKAFNEILRTVFETSSTFVAPGIAVNTFNRLNHHDQLYFSVFSPSLNPRWDGNLKRYRLGSDGSIMDNSTPSKAAIDPTTGFFSNEARSWWSEENDGPKVGLGGAAHKIPDDNATRKVYSYLTGNDLTASTNAVTVANKAYLGKALFGDSAMSDADHEKLINWTRGADVFDADSDGSTKDSRKWLADPLHSVPHIVTYGGTTDKADITIFYGDNQGFLHAVNGDTGEAYFSFIPKELLSIQADLMDNDPNMTYHPYGLDGSANSWVKDANHNGVVDSGDHVYVYIGMRRGGNNYYALDVTNRTAPKMLFTIDGGSTGFTELGQTWSRPIKTKIMINKTVHDVLVFSGGYDPQQDNVNVRTEDTVGRALYIVDATTGALLWSAGPASSSTANLKLADMKYSIPATPRVLDVSGDGLADQIYVGDMGGQVWRFDIVNGRMAKDLVSGAVIADLADGTTAGNRRFYHTPDLFGFKYGTKRILGLVIGSGYQAHPLNKTIEDRIYMLRIHDATGFPDANDDGVADYVKLKESNLFDSTDNLIQQGTDAQKKAASATLNASSTHGWYIRLTRNGEKVLASSQTIRGEMFITSYEPSSASVGCTPTAGTPRLYHLNIVDGSAMVNYDGIGAADALTKEDREFILKTTGLPASPQRMRVDGKDSICVGTECIKFAGGLNILNTYWYEE